MNNNQKYTSVINYHIDQYRSTLKTQDIRIERSLLDPTQYQEINKTVEETGISKEILEKIPFNLNKYKQETPLKNKQDIDKAAVALLLAIFTEDMNFTREKIDQAAQQLLIFTTSNSKAPLVVRIQSYFNALSNIPSETLEKNPKLVKSFGESFINQDTEKDFLETCQSNAVLSAFVMRALSPVSFEKIGTKSEMLNQIKKHYTELQKFTIFAWIVGVINLIKTWWNADAVTSQMTQQVKNMLMLEQLLNGDNVDDVVNFLKACTNQFPVSCTASVGALLFQLETNCVSIDNISKNSKNQKIKIILELSQSPYFNSNMKAVLSNVETDEVDFLALAKTSTFLQKLIDYSGMQSEKIQLLQMVEGKLLTDQKAKTQQTNSKVKTSDLLKFQSIFNGGTVDRFGLGLEDNDEFNKDNFNRGNNQTAQASKA